MNWFKNKAIGYFGRKRDKEVYMNIPNEDAISGIHFTQCLDCNGKGIFMGPDFKTACNICKGTGKVPINV